MRINTKDILAAAVLISIAAVGLWLNTEHNLGSARRMGPGYMPMLVFWIQIGLGVLVLGFAMVNGPDPLDHWTQLDIASPLLGAAAFTAIYLTASGIEGWTSTGWNSLGLAGLVGSLVVSISPGWRKLFLIIAAMCLFGLILESGGLMLSIVATIALASLADETHRPKGVLLLILFLCVLCWVIFIHYLDIRVPVWPWAQY